MFCKLTRDRPTAGWLISRQTAASAVMLQTVSLPIISAIDLGVSSEGIHSRLPRNTVAVAKLLYSVEFVTDVENTAASAGAGYQTICEPPAVSKPMLVIHDQARFCNNADLTRCRSPTDFSPRPGPTGNHNVQIPGNL